VGLDRFAFVAERTSEIEGVKLAGGVFDLIVFAEE
jgi:hypothetical protein